MISGERVNLRALEPEDLDNCMSWINDPEVTNNLSIGLWPTSRKSEEAWLAGRASGTDQANKVLAIETKDGLYLGNIGLHGIDYVSGAAELGIVIGRKDYWSKGYGTDACRALLRHAFANLRLRKVILRVFGSNDRARKAYEKLGFREVGRLKSHTLKNGVYEDEVVMEVFAEELTGADTFQRHEVKA